MSVVPLCEEWAEVMPIFCDDGLAWAVSLERAGAAPEDATLAEFYRTEDEARLEARAWGISVRICHDAGRIAMTVEECIN